MVEHGVASSGCAIKRQSYFVGEQRCGVVFMVYEEVCEVLAHPFFGCEFHPTFAEWVEHAMRVVCLLGETYGEGGKVEWLHVLNFKKNVQKEVELSSAFGNFAAKEVGGSSAEYVFSCFLLTQLFAMSINLRKFSIKMVIGNT